MIKRLLSKIDKGEPFRRSDFRLLDWKMRQYVRGNFVAFGIRQGLMANITLLSPLLNTIIHYKYRAMYLVLDSDPLINAAIIRQLEDE